MLQMKFVGIFVLCARNTAPAEERLYFHDPFLKR